MSDLISRQSAIEALQEHRNLFCDNTPETFSKLSYAEKSRVDELDMAIATLINLPSAQPEPCVDTISRKAAIEIASGFCHPANIAKELAKLPSAQPDMSEYSDKLWKAAYERGKAEAQQRWIPCSERLPENEEQVLIYAWNVHYVLAKYREIRTCDGVYKMAWVTEDAYSTPREIKHKVICWMPLPEPYREGGD